MENIIKNNHTTDVESKIKQVLSDLERKRDIKILFAVDTGSRSTGLEAPTSDHDLKVIYVERLKWYLRIDVEEQQEEIVEKYEDDSIQIDIMCFNLRKTLQLMRKSNPTLFEMLASKIVYAEDKQVMSVIRSELNVYFSQKTLSFHYINVARENYRDYIMKKNQVNRKKYLYIILTILRVLYMKQKSQEMNTHDDTGMEVTSVVAPLNYNELLQPLIESGVIKSECLDDLNYLIERKKKESGQWSKEPPMDNMYQWIEDMRREAKAYADNVLAQRKRYYDTIDTEQIRKHGQILNDLFYDTVNRFDTIHAI
jgi:predicted nucleotidyltransferase